MHIVNIEKMPSSNIVYIDVKIEKLYLVVVAILYLTQKHSSPL